MAGSSIANTGAKSLSQFAREIDLPSMRSPYFQKWDAAKRKLSDLAWDLHSTNAYAHYRATNPGAGEPPLSASGIYDQGQLDAADTESLYKLFHECPAIPYSADDFQDGYSFDPSGALGNYNTYRRMTPAFEAKLGEVLAKIAPKVEEICGHHFRIVSSHIWSLNPGPQRFQWHFDWWPIALKKLFILPGGVDETRGSTAFRLKTGEERLIKGPPGTWMVFENSGVEHKGFESPTEARPTIAISFAPSFRTDLRLFDAGANSGYPFFPLEDPLGHGPSPNDFSADDFKFRTLKRIIELSGLDVTLSADGTVHVPAPTMTPTALAPQSPLPVPSWPRMLRYKLGTLRRRLFGL